MQDDDGTRDTLLRSVVSIGIFGDDLDPAEVTALMGCPPSKAGRKGEPLGNSRRRDRIIPRRPVGAWILRADERRPADFGGQVRELLGRLTPDLAVWAGLSARFRMRIFCGVFMERFNEELGFTAEVVALMAQRGLRLQLDIYGPVDDDDDDPAEKNVPRLN